MNSRFKKGALVWYLQRDGTHREAKVGTSPRPTLLSPAPEAADCVLYAHAFSDFHASAIGLDMMID